MKIDIYIYLDFLVQFILQWVNEIGNLLLDSINVYTIVTMDL